MGPDPPSYPETNLAMTRLRLCPFCFEEANPSREHPSSQPVRDALRLDWETVTGSVATNSGESGIPVPAQPETRPGVPAPASARKQKRRNVRRKRGMCEVVAYQPEKR